MILNVSRSGARLELPCANVEIKEPILVDGQGRFNVPGTYAREGPGPVREDDPRLAVRLEGTLAGDTIECGLVMPDRREGFRLVFGKKAKLIKCR